MDHEQRKQIIPGLQPQMVRFSYSVAWKPTDIAFEDRLTHLNDASFLPQSLEIHWLSIVNSVVLVVLLTAFLGIILLRIVRNDLTQYLTEDEEEGMMEVETGWKLVHTEVFRAPEYPNLFASIIGAGAHLFATGTALLLVALTGAFSYSRRGAMLSATILLYALTSVVGGYVSGRLYKQLGGGQWVWNTITTMLMFPLPLFALFVFLNTTAFAHASIAALPIGTILLLCGVFIIVAFPLTLLGSILGKNTTTWTPPVRTNKVRREIPLVPWYRSPLLAGLLLGGLLPFSAISIEVHYTFAAIWGHKVYTFFGILALAFVLLALVTAFVVVALVYYQLAQEDWQWWWRSVVGGGAVSLYIMAYSFVYFFNHSDMSGFLQVSFFFGYMGLVAYAFFLMQAFVGFSSALVFVRYIYAQIKTE
jgi:transmembrane 9 superfamily protein 1